MIPVRHSFPYYAFRNEFIPVFVPNKKSRSITKFHSQNELRSGLKIANHVARGEWCMRI